MTVNHTILGHEHTTTTYGTRIIQPEVVLMVLRVKPGRLAAANEDVEQQKRIVSVLDKWVDRWCDRHDKSFMGTHVTPVGNPPDAMAVSFMVADSLPVDWHCFGGIVLDVMRGPRNSPMVLASGNLADIMSKFDLPDIEPTEPEDKTKVN